MTGRGRYAGWVAVLVAVVVIHGAVDLPARRRLPSPSRGPVAETVVPTATEAIAHAERLDLTPEQRQRLETLAAALEVEAGEAMEAFGQFAKQARVSGRTALEDIARRPEGMRQRSFALRALRELQAARLLATLEEGQRARLHDGRRTMTGGLR